MLIDQKRIANILTQNSFIVWLLEVVDILKNVNTLALTALRWLVYPKVIIFLKLTFFIFLFILFIFVLDLIKSVVEGA